MPEPIASFIGALQAWLFESVVLPALAWAGALRYTEDAFNGTEEFVLVVLDFAQYWVHRAQHHAGWWWALHSLHHSQRQMTFWTDNRNHLLDSVITDAIFAAIALAIGVPPAQFALLVVVSRMVESLSHANVRMSFGALGARLLVSPRFHRLHHAIAASPHGDYRGANYAVLLPVWDVLFGTADFRREPGPTGVDDQLAGRDYGEGFWAQQWLGLKRMAGRA